MLTFFRRVRKGQLDSSQARKYLLYAIGEIALVVVGILIALQINNWNQQRKNDIRKQSYLDNLKIDLIKDIGHLEALDSLNTFYETEGIYLDEYLNGLLPNIDTVRLFNAIVLVEYIPNMTIVSTTYNDIMNSNNIVLFEDVELKKLLDNYYIPNAWNQLFNDRILNTAWDKYTDEMLKYHSPVLYKNYYESYPSSLKEYKTAYNVKWDEMKNNDYLKTQVGMIGAYRILLRNNFKNKVYMAKELLTYLEKLN